MNVNMIVSLLAALGMAVLSQTAIAWEDGPCPSGGGGPAPCFELTEGGVTKHFNGDGSHKDIWHGPLGHNDPDFPIDQNNTFEFCGETQLTCDNPIIGELEVTCELCLYGQVRKCFDEPADTWRVGIRITRGTNSPGDFFCNLISLQDFPWYAGPDDFHGPYSNDCSVGIAWPGPLVGSIGAIGVSPVGISGAHIHGVSYNNVNAFTFNGSLVDPTDLPAGCAVNGVLTLTSGGSLSIM